jgi:Ca2+-binding RTX toxin-like protein
VFETDRDTGFEIYAIGADGDDPTRLTNSKALESQPDWSVPSAPPGPGGDCTVRGTNRDDVLRGTTEPDIICGLGGDDRLVGREGDDVLRGGKGDDRINGGPGLDEFIAGAGNDFVNAVDGGSKSGGESVNAGPGSDVCRADTNDELRGCET